MQEEKEQTSEKVEHRQQQFPWQSSAGASSWSQQFKWRETIFGEATQRMLAAAELSSGNHVLDIAAGTGDQSLAAAQKVGPTGKILATDISAEMLKEAANLFAQEGATTITTRTMSAEQLDLADETFDAIICRLGLMFIQKRQQAFLEIRRVLKPNRKFAALVWSTPEHNYLLSKSTTLIAKYAPDSPQVPTTFSLADAAIFEHAFKDAGFREISIQAVPIQFHFASMDAFFQQISNNPVVRVMKQLEPPEQQRLQEEVRQAFQKFEGPQGLVLPAELLLGVGTR